MPTTSPASGRGAGVGSAEIGVRAPGPEQRGWPRVAGVAAGVLAAWPGPVVADPAGWPADAVLQPALTSTAASTDQQIRGLLRISATLAPPSPVRGRDRGFHPRVQASLCAHSCPASSAVATGLGSRSAQLS